MSKNCDIYKFIGVISALIMFISLMYFVGTACGRFLLIDKLQSLLAEFLVEMENYQPSGDLNIRELQTLLENLLTDVTNGINNLDKVFEGLKKLEAILNALSAAGVTLGAAGVALAAFFSGYNKGLNENNSERFKLVINPTECSP